MVLPFPGAARDFERLPALTPAAPREDELRHWVYVGRGGGDMATALRGLFTALRDHAPAELLEHLRLHFIGTSYAAAGKGQKTIAPIAAEFGLEHLLDEQPDRIPYADTLAWLKRADALIVPGSDDPAYTASKIYPYLLAGRPLLAIFQARSSVVDLIEKVGGAVCVPFEEDESAASLGRRISEKWLRQGGYQQITPLDATAFRPYSDSESARRLTEFFQTCVGS